MARTVKMCDFVSKYSRDDINLIGSHIVQVIMKSNPIVSQIIDSCKRQETALKMCLDNPACTQIAREDTSIGKGGNPTVPAWFGIKRLLSETDCKSIGAFVFGRQMDDGDEKYIAFRQQTCGQLRKKASCATGNRWRDIYGHQKCK